MLHLSHPEFNQRARWSQAELQLCISELPSGLFEKHRDLNAQMDELEKDEKKIKKRNNEIYKNYLEIVCSQCSRLELFGHPEFLKGFVRPGELTTRYEISIGLLTVLIKNLALNAAVGIGPQDIDIAIVPCFEIIRMPDINFEAEMIKVMDKYKYDARKHTIFMKKIYQHLTDRISFVMDLNLPIPEAPPSPSGEKDTKPCLRVIKLGADKKYFFVFVDEVKLVIDRLKGRKNIDWKSKRYHPYFPLEYLEYALELFGCKMDQISLVSMPVGRKENGIYCYTPAPNGENVVPAESCLFRFAEAYNKATENGKKMDLMRSFKQFLHTGQVLPYFVKYFTDLETQPGARQISMSAYMKKRMTTTENCYYDEVEMKKKIKGIQQKKETIPNVPPEVTTSFPAEFRFTISALLKSHSEVSLA
ncbi:hypothetical protein GCK72_000432 [Caenorhabditis remanei]|uniref:Uncharacterized protein n=1 Tax=Caenorhabditis remanei TaxID=31234 RepID=A0A6A5HKB6_CAERE|nr:hypothetical protein GCK72_000432 [Caenorhabditis remanei]KAF1768620.1 hypothetical protein GCK72_000432 [Caenorhabditis remanei]